MTNQFAASVGVGYPVLLPADDRSSANAQGVAGNGTGLPVVYTGSAIGGVGNTLSLPIGAGNPSSADVVSKAEMEATIHRILSERAPRGDAHGAAVQHYPPEIVSVAMRRPGNLIGWDFIMNQTVLPTDGRNMFGCASYKEQVEFQKDIRKSCTVLKFDPIAKPDEVIEWLKSTHRRHKEHDAHSGAQRSLIYASMQLEGCPVEVGLSSYLSQPYVLAASPRSKYCCTYASLLDYFSAPRYTAVADQAFKNMAFAAGVSMYSAFQQMYVLFVRSRLNDPDENCKVVIFLERFMSRLLHEEVELIRTHFPNTALQNFEQFKTLLSTRSWTLQPRRDPPRVAPILPPKRSRPLESKGPTPSEKAPHDQCVCEKCGFWYMSNRRGADRCMSCFGFGHTARVCENAIQYLWALCKSCGQLIAGKYGRGHEKGCPKLLAGEIRGCIRCNEPHYVNVCPYKHDKSLRPVLPAPIPPPVAPAGSSSPSEPPSKVPRVS